MAPWEAASPYLVPKWRATVGVTGASKYFTTIPLKARTPPRPNGEASVAMVTFVSSSVRRRMYLVNFVQAFHVEEAVLVPLVFAALPPLAFLAPFDFLEARVKHPVEDLHGPTGPWQDACHPRGFLVGYLEAESRHRGEDEGKELVLLPPSKAHKLSSRYTWWLPSAAWMQACKSRARSEATLLQRRGAVLKPKRRATKMYTSSSRLRLPWLPCSGSPAFVSAFAFSTNAPRSHAVC